MVPVLNTYDWQEAFGAAMGTEAEACEQTRRNARPALGFQGDVSPFCRADVADVIAHVDGENDGADWVCVVRLGDGRFAVVRAGCDYTGWDCRANGDAEVAADLPTLVRLCVNPEERRRLGLAEEEAPASRP
jgi:hypothetical protein